MNPVVTVNAQICILSSITAALRDRILISMTIITDVHAEMVQIVQIFAAYIHPQIVIILSSGVAVHAQTLIMVNIIVDVHAQMVQIFRILKSIIADVRARISIWILKILIDNGAVLHALTSI